MRIPGTRIVVLLAGLSIVSAGCVVAGSVPVSAVPAPGAPPEVEQVCGAVPDGYARCLAQVQRGAATPAATPAAALRSPPRGLSPKMIKAAYGFPTTPNFGTGQTIAIVGAYDAPTVESDLAVFEKQFGLPSCTTANGCFTKVNQLGAPTPLPASNAGWALETHIDVQWAHAIAPGAKILLVEATSNRFVDLLKALDTAKVHAAYVSNSWGTNELSGEAAFEHHFSQTEAPGVSFFFGSGDAGAPGLYPSASPSVTSVGGTTLSLSSNGRFKQETGWSGSGGGCSKHLTASAAQAAFPQYTKKGCAGKRAAPDLALVADPRSGVAVYDSQPVGGTSGWVVMGGTSVATPLVAARAAGSKNLVTQNLVYGDQLKYRDVLRGNNGFPCTAGYDVVTGRGTWIG
jgi:subtilase family serine protease